MHTREKLTNGSSIEQLIKIGREYISKGGITLDQFKEQYEISDWVWKKYKHRMPKHMRFGRIIIIPLSAIREWEQQQLHRQI